MPRLSYFYGIAISMFWDEGHHVRPHFHAYYGEHEASLDLTGEIIVGDLPGRDLPAPGARSARAGRATC
jgi:Domain of unknown function (DUF4160)